MVARMMMIMTMTVLTAPMTILMMIRLQIISELQKTLTLLARKLPSLTHFHGNFHQKSANQL